MLDRAQIAIQPEPDTCAHTAVVNALRLRGQDTTVAQVRNLFRNMKALQKRAGIPVRDDDGPTVWDLHLALSHVPGLCASVGHVPPAFWDYPKPVLSYFLNAGCHLIIFFNLYAPERAVLANHVVVAESYDERGMVVLDSEPGYLEGTTIELQPEPYTPDQLDEAEAWLENNSHGSRRVLPFYGVQRPPERIFGLSPYFVILHPAEAVEEMRRAQAEHTEALTAAPFALPTPAGGTQSLIDRRRPWPRQQAAGE